MISTSFPGVAALNRLDRAMKRRIFPNASTHTLDRLDQFRNTQCRLMYTSAGLGALANLVLAVILKRTQPVWIQSRNLTRALFTGTLRPLFAGYTAGVLMSMPKALSNFTRFLRTNKGPLFQGE